MNDYWKMALLAAGAAATGGLLAAPAAGAAGAGAAGAGELLGAGEAAGASGWSLTSLLGNADAAMTYGTGLGTEHSAMLAAQDAGFNPGMLQSGWNTLSGSVKPVGQAMSTANAAKGLFPQSQPVQPSPMTQTPATGPGALAWLTNQMQQMGVQRQQEDMQRRMKQRELVARMGGFNGRNS